MSKQRSLPIILVPRPAQSNLLTINGALSNSQLSTFTNDLLLYLTTFVIAMTVIGYGAAVRALRAE